MSSYYFDKKNWELNSEGRGSKVPTWFVMAFMPLIGAAFVVFMPFIGLALTAKYLFAKAALVGEGVWHFLARPFEK